MPAMSWRSQPPEDPSRLPMWRLARGADRVCALILDGDLPAVDIDIAIENLRDEAEQLFPGCDELFERIYGSRFERLRAQFPRGIPG